MSYVEDAIYTFIKNILTKGIVVLTNKRFILYTTIAIILPALLTTYTFIQGGDEITTIYNILYNLELAVCATLIITGLVSLKVQLVKIELAFFIGLTSIFFGLSFFESSIINIVENFFVYVSFYSWIVTINLAGLNAIREFIVSWPGWVVRLGDKNDRIMFSPIVKIALFASLGWFTYMVWTDFSWSLLMGFMCAAAVFYTIYIFLPLTKDASMTSIICFFYFILLYHLFVRAESSTGVLLMDIIIIVIVTIFTAQSISNLIASKKHSMPYHWDSLIIILLGFMLGYHLLGVRIAIQGGLSVLYSFYHDIAFGFGTIMIYGILLLYAGKKGFRDFAKSRITPGEVLNQASNAGLEAITSYAKSLKESIKNKNWSFEIKKKEKE